MRAGWLTPDSLPAELRTCKISFPDSEEFHSLVRGALFLLSQEDNWEEFGSLTVQQTADVFRDMLVRFFGDDCMELPIGTVLEFAGVVLPDNYLWAHGQAISRADYASLFAVIGTVFGAGNGSTTFNVPDRRGKTAVGSFPGTPLNWDVGDVGGEINHTLTKAEIPADLDYYYGFGGSVTAHAMTATTTSVLSSGFVNPSGGGSHNNMPPYVIMDYIIRYR